MMHTYQKNGQAHYQKFLNGEQAVDHSLLDAKEGLIKLFSASDYAAWVATQYKQEIVSLIEVKSLARSYREGELRELVRAAVVAAGDQQNVLMHALRVARHLELFRIAYRDINQLASLDEILLDTSDLADACIQSALEVLQAWHAKRWGVPRDAQGNEQQLIVLGMGKLGGQELNFSSDIDLIFAFGDHGETDASVPETSIQFFTRLAQALIKVLNEATEDGFVYRVDTRLRPFGDSGPLVVSQAALENYLLNQGREWERYAMIKARIVAGDMCAGENMLAAVKPFVYRRYLDYGAFESLRDMKRRINNEISRKRMQADIKLGRGGIREIEFIAQAFQLIRGGREPELQQRRLFSVLDALGLARHLSAKVVTDLKQAYEFLRLTENRLQMLADEQTHHLPTQMDAQSRLAQAMNFSDWEAFKVALDAHQNKVSAQFEAVFQTEEPEKNQLSDDSLLLALWHGEVGDTRSQAALKALNYKKNDAIKQRLYDLRQGVFYSNLTATGRRRVNQLMPNIISACAEYDAADGLLLRMLNLVQSIAGRSVYFSFLNENPAALKRLVSFSAQSPWLADYLRQHPILLDDLLEVESAEKLLDLQQFQLELHRHQRRVDSSDIEARLESLRNFKHSHVFRIAAADLNARLPLMKVSDQLTWLAETILNAIYQLVWHELLEKYGRPKCLFGDVVYYPELMIVGYGKLGGLELGYASDLDLVFLHNSQGGEQVTDGEKVIDNTTFFTRFAQRMINYLSTRTSAGVLYEIDTRLRPNGQSGLLVSSISAFAEYQTKEAWTWEHQALVRARPVAGSETLWPEFALVRAQTLSKAANRLNLKTEIIAMRDKMIVEHKSADLLKQIKYQAGGINDIEFMVQYHVLAAAQRYADLLAHSDNIRQLDALAARCVLPPAQVKQLSDCYRGLREYSHRYALRGDAPDALEPGIEDMRQQVQACWAQLMSN